jgi:hypothetical protein
MEDQGRLLEEALGVVRQQGQQMRRCLETPGKLMDALKCGCVAHNAHSRSVTDEDPAQRSSPSYVPPP